MESAQGPGGPKTPPADGDSARAVAPGGGRQPARDGQSGADATGQHSGSEAAGRQLVYFAAERTLMAWVRAALGLMALGFVIDRFGLILRHVVPGAGEQLHPREFSFWAGTLLVAFGALMAFVAAGRYLHFSIAYHRAGDTRPRQGILMGVLFAAVLGLFGLLIAAFLTAATVG
jgi:putative membrane protein